MKLSLIVLCTAVLALTGCSTHMRSTQDVSFERQARWPVWWRWHYWRGGTIRSQQRQIAHGTFETKSDGSFIIEFDAIPDAAVPEESEPTFVYRIAADVTDGSGTIGAGCHATRQRQQLLRRPCPSIKAGLPM